ncbi:MAG: hypothetical protein BWK80_42775 [Desulfobacteraceae bacterium IS3]|nr:MAG: hypothetical protein BWK80_42775 [Desulfobacteraceae bacterium IS3]
MSRNKACMCVLKFLGAGRADKAQRVRRFIKHKGGHGFALSALLFESKTLSEGSISREKNDCSDL